MGERKVLNKYFPPDFDPAKIPRRRLSKNQQINVRMMLPMCIRCATCGNYIYKGTKFNSRKEEVRGETYLGIHIFRFYFKCTKCFAEITYKTDHKNSDYTVESGATRNFEPWRANDDELEYEKQKRDAEERGDTMKSLENRTLDSKRKIDIDAALDETISLKSRQSTVSVDAMLEALQQREEAKMKKMNEDDEALIRSIFQNQRSREFVKRINDDELEDNDDLVSCTGPRNNSPKRRKVFEEPNEKPTDTLIKAGITESSNNRDKASSSDGKTIFKSSSVKVSIVKKLSSDSNKNKIDDGNKQEVESTSLTNNCLQSLCQQYESDEDD